MIIATWNVQNGTTHDRLDGLLEKYNPDIVFFQETSFLKESDEVFWTGQNLSKGISLWSRFKFHIIEPTDLSSSAIAAIFPDTPFGSLNVLGVWAQKQPDYDLDIQRTLRTYSGFINSRPTIILGDFNLDRRIVGKATNFDQVNKQIEQGLGMRSAYHAYFNEPFGNEICATHYHLRKRERPFHCDFIYVPHSMVKNIEEVSVPDYRSFETSDHRPVICCFDSTNC